MKTIFNCLLTFFALQTVAIAGQFSLPEHQQIKLNNGLTINLMEQHEVPLIHVDIRIKAGAINTDLGGLADVTARSLTFGAGNLSKQQIEQQLDFIGARLDTWADSEQSGIDASFLKQDQAKVFSVLQKILTNAKFEQQDFSNFMQRYASEIAQRKESPKQVIHDYFRKLVFQQSPYAKSNYAKVSELKALSRDVVVDFYQTYYQPQNTIISVVGDFNTKAMKQQLKNLFVQWRNNQHQNAKLIAKSPEPKQAQVLLVDKKDAIETTFLIGGKGIRRNNPDYIGISVVNTILGGRFTSWLNTALRTDSGLSYGARSRFASNAQDGYFYISSFTKVDTTEQALDLALKTYEKIFTQGLTQQSLDSAKAYLKGQFPPKYESGASLAGFLSDMAIYGISEDYINQFNQQVDALTLEQSKHIIEQYFPRKNLQMVLIGKAARIRKIAKKYGKVTEVSI